MECEIVAIYSTHRITLYYPDKDTYEDIGLAYLLRPGSGSFFPTDNPSAQNSTAAVVRKQQRPSTDPSATLGTPKTPASTACDERGDDSSSRDVDVFSVDARDYMRRNYLGKSAIFQSVGRNHGHLIVNDGEENIAMRLLELGLSLTIPTLYVPKNDTGVLSEFQLVEQNARKKMIGLHAQYRPAEHTRHIFPFPTDQLERSILVHHLIGATARFTVEKCISPCMLEGVAFSNQYLRVKLCGLTSSTLTDATSNSARAKAQRQMLHRTYSVSLHEFDESTNTFFGNIVNWEAEMIELLIHQGACVPDYRTIFFSKYSSEILSAVRSPSCRLPSERKAEAEMLTGFYGVAVEVISGKSFTVKRVEAPTEGSLLPSSFQVDSNQQTASNKNGQAAANVEDALPMDDNSESRGKQIGGKEASSSSSAVEKRKGKSFSPETITLSLAFLDCDDYYEVVEKSDGKTIYRSSGASCLARELLRGILIGQLVEVRPVVFSTPASVSAVVFLQDPTSGESHVLNRRLLTLGPSLYRAVDITLSPLSITIEAPESIVCCPSDSSDANVTPEIPVEPFVDILRWTPSEPPLSEVVPLGQEVMGVIEIMKDCTHMEVVLPQLRVQVLVRLCGVEAPNLEASSPTKEGPLSDVFDAMTCLCLHRDALITFVAVEEEVHVAWVRLVSGLDLSLEVLSRGYGIVADVLDYVSFADSGVLLNVQAEARETQRGLWSPECKFILEQLTENREKEVGIQLASTAIASEPKSVQITAIPNSSSVYVSYDTPELAANKKKVSDALHRLVHDRKLQRVRPRFEIGDSVAVRWGEEEWYRGQITATHPTLRVFYVDVGYEEEAYENDVVLPKKSAYLTEICPPLAVETRHAFLELTQKAIRGSFVQRGVQKFLSLGPAIMHEEYYKNNVLHVTFLRQPVSVSAPLPVEEQSEPLPSPAAKVKGGAQSRDTDPPPVRYDQLPAYLLQAISPPDVELLTAPVKLFPCVTKVFFLASVVRPMPLKLKYAEKEPRGK